MTVLTCAFPAMTDDNSVFTVWQRHSPDYVVIVKEYQSTVYGELVENNWNAESVQQHEAEWEKQHGRLEPCRCRKIDVSGSCGASFWSCRVMVGNPDRATVLRVTLCTDFDGYGRCPTAVAAGARDIGRTKFVCTTYATSPMTNDLCRPHVTNMPQNLACLSNPVSPIIRCQGRFEYISSPNGTSP